MHQSDDLVVEFDYTDTNTHRVVSPVRFLGRDRFLGLCLSREEPGQFYLERCRNVQLARAADFLLPVAMAGEGGGASPLGRRRWPVSRPRADLGKRLIPTGLDADTPKYQNAGEWRWVPSSHSSLSAFMRFSVLDSP
jgi:hypothetical protein